MRRLILVGMTALFALALPACTKDAATGGLALTPTGQVVAGIACQVDAIAQPIALPFIAGIPTVGGIVATADQAVGHPLVQKACGDLAASLGTAPASAKPILVPAVPIGAAVPTS